MEEQPALVPGGVEGDGGPQAAPPQTAPGAALAALAPAPTPAPAPAATAGDDAKPAQAKDMEQTAATVAATSSPPVLKGTLVGLFVVIDPARQGQKLNMKRALESLGIHQRDLAPGEEVQLSLEQAFYLCADLKALDVYLPPVGTGAEADAAPQEAAGERGSPSPATPAPGPLSTLECWKAFRAASSTFVQSVGSYRYFREQGFVVHGGLNLGLDFMLYRGTPQRYHAEFGVLLRYPSLAPPAGGQGGEAAMEGRAQQPPEEGQDSSKEVLNWRELHLLYRLIGEVRKTLILGHVRLGQVGEEANEEEQPEPKDAPAGDGDREMAREMARWYTGLSMYEVAVTPWRAGTPLARMSKGRGDAAAQVKRGGGQGGRKRGRGGGAGRGRGEQGEQPPGKRQNQQG